MLKNCIMPKNQHGFVPKKSTVINLLECFNDWASNFDNKVPTYVVHLDYSKCFDKVYHTNLLYKLSQYGITDFALSWLENFLTNRVQRDKVNSCLSPPIAVSSGVLQGTLLGPLLFLRYSVKNSIISMSADDTNLYKSILIYKTVCYFKKI